MNSKDKIKVNRLASQLQKIINDNIDAIVDDAPKVNQLSKALAFIINQIEGEIQGYENFIEQTKLDPKGENVSVSRLQCETALQSHKEILNLIKEGFGYYDINFDEIVKYYES